MGSWVDRLGLVVLDASISAAVLLAVLAPGVVFCRQPARRLRLIQGALVGLLAMIPLKGLDRLPQIQLGLLPEQLGIWGLSGESPWGWGGSWPSGEGVGWLRLAVAGYGLGVAGSLAWLGLGYLGVARLVRRSSAPSRTARALFDSLAAGGTRCRPALRVSARLRCPILAGLWRPAIVIPAEYDPPDPTPADRERLRLVLLHELAHHQGRDPWFLLAGRLAQSFWFFLPPLGWLLERMRLDQELVADRRASIGFGSAGDYAASLLDLAATADPVGVAGAIPSDGGAGAPPDGPPIPDDPFGSPIFQRLWTLICSPVPVEATAPRWWSWSLPGFTAALTLGASSLAVVPASAARAPAADGTAGRPRTFVISHLEIAAAGAQLNGRVARVELPIRLPEAFELSVEVLASPAALGRTRIAGQVLGAGAVTLSPAVESPATWHPVRLHRDTRGDALWIDGRPTELAPDPDPLPLWLTIEPPPDHDGRYRNLLLRW